VREHHYEIITMFIWGLRPKIRCTVITGSYDLDTVEEAFDFAIKVDVTFKTIVNIKARCYKCEGYEHYDYHCPSESQHVRIVPGNDVDDLKVVEDVHVPPKTTSIIKT